MPESGYTERARELIAEKLDWLGAGTDMATDDSVRTLLAHPDLLADLAIEAGGLEQGRRAAVAESIYQRRAEGWHAVMHEIIERPCWNREGDTEPLTPEQVAWLRGEPLPEDRRTRKGERDGD